MNTTGFDGKKNKPVPVYYLCGHFTAAASVYCTITSGRHFIAVRKVALNILPCIFAHLRTREFGIYIEMGEGWLAGMAHRLVGTVGEWSGVCAGTFALIDEAPKARQMGCRGGANK